MKLKAFTLAEVLSVVAILGIVAAITIPATLHHYDTESSRAMIRKAANVYEHAVNNMSIERGLYSDGALQEYAGAENCKNLSNYFKQINEDGCYFQTPDGVYWYFGDSVTRPLVSTQKINPDTLAQRIVEATNPNDEETFYLIGRFDGTGALRINDLQYERTVNNSENNNVFILSKLYAFTRKIANTSFYDSLLDELPLFKNHDFDSACTGGKKVRCTETVDGVTTVYDSGGRVLARQNEGETGYSFNRTFSDKSGTAVEEGCSADHTGCGRCTGNESLCKNSRLGYTNCPHTSPREKTTKDEVTGETTTEIVNDAWDGYCTK